MSSKKSEIGTQVDQFLKRTTATTPISFRLPTEQVKHLKKKSHQISLERDCDVSYVDLIREAINNNYPMKEKE